ncbi:MurNAc alpha-1-phosphate uridylyltransferase [Hasllibacter halocynthiae]|uniref:MurNAc alpha-1-phosphate uridylyltransferase n=1 Tax=Hasllibacter halocynthiae TaxID=595589 RepID=A0A2T0X2J4_9RHOB|nr:nucleotidyltransferase family protein [Hasllibacter halocynthiae]PRY93166.1 MurNAc alpha-1-phosphate uridylyltransferase [Hasllibacter halocynthiae]
MRDRPDALMVFAAGFGTRMRPLTDAMPKPLIEVGGRTLLDRALALGAGRAPVVVNAHYRAAQIERHLEGRGVHVLREDPILDTGGGLRAALPVLGPGPVLTLNPDGVFGGPNPLALLRGAWDGAAEAVLLLAPAGAVGRARGDFDMDEAGALRRGGAYAFLGAQALRTGGLREMPEGAFSLNLLWDAMIGRGTLRGLRYPGRWTDVGTPEGIGAAERMLEARDVPAG